MTEGNATERKNTDHIYSNIKSLRCTPETNIM